MIIATAGHVDHGKTALVRALTGIHTDRLPEERARDMTIDLGFAYVRNRAGRILGIVDVPGHGRFIRNMVSGVAGVDGVMLVMAADDGAMPQTLEHLRIVRWLGVPLCTAVLTKIDRVDQSRVEAVLTELAGLVGRAVPVFPVSSYTGEGIAALRRHLNELADRVSPRDSSGLCRLAIDRAFRREGHGLVVTGTLYSGAIRCGDELRLTPDAACVRVRRIQVAGSDVDEAKVGQRCALNLAGASAERVARGEWLLDPKLHEPSRSIQARIDWHADDNKLPRSGEKVRIHVGAAVADATLQFLPILHTRDSTSVILRLGKPLFILRGDRLLVRDRNGTRTVGGGTVTDPFVTWGRKQRVIPSLNDVPLDAPPEHALAHIAGIENPPVDLRRFEIAFGLGDAEARKVRERARVRMLNTGAIRVGISAGAEAKWRTAIYTAVSLHHVKTPEASGLPLNSLAEAVGLGSRAEIVTALARFMVQEGELEIEGTLIRVPGFRATISEEDAQVMQRAEVLLEDTACSPWRQKDLARALRIDEGSLAKLLLRLTSEGRALRIADRVFAGPHVARRLAVAANELVGDPCKATFKAAEFRDATGLNRRTAIYVLEFFDCIRLTRREGDARRLLRRPEDVFGEVVTHAR